MLSGAKVQAERKDDPLEHVRSYASMAAVTKRLTVRGWSERTGIPANIIYVRLSRGWTLERAVGTPVPAAPGRMTRATEKKEPAMKTIGKAIYAVICLALLAATITAQSQGWTTTFYLAFLAVATPGATMWAWRHLMRA